MSLIQVVPLGGAGEIGKNMTAIAQGDDMVLVDCGMSFPNEEQYGIDVVVPDITYLLENRDKLKAIVLTHAHEDHVGALSYALPQLKRIPVYCTEFTGHMVRMKLDEKLRGFDIDLRTVKPGDTIQAGKLPVEFVRVTHSIPETCCIAVHTTHGIVLLTSDFKFDFTPVDGKLTDITRLSELGKEGVLLMMSDSTNADRPGWGPSESRVLPGLRKAFEEAPGRVLVTMFSSNIHRMQQVVDAAQLTGRKVAVAGRRIDMTVEMCQRTGYMKVPKGTYVKIEDIGKYSPEEVVILTTGSQGEPMAALSQMSRQEYSRMQIRPGDTVLYSARPIPGNEAGIWRTVNRLFRLGAHVVYESPTPIHVSGHAYQEELKMMINLTKPYYLAPIHGEARHQHIYQEMAQAMGYPEYRMFTLENGDVLNMDDQKAWKSEKVTWGEVLIDQTGGLGVTPTVMQERVNLGHDGVVVVSVGADLKRGEIVRRPTIQAKGFSGGDEVLDLALTEVCDAIGRMSAADLKSSGSIERTILDAARRIILRRSEQRPVILPTVVELN